MGAQPIASDESHSLPPVYMKSGVINSGLHIGEVYWSIYREDIDNLEPEVKDFKMLLS